MSRNFQISLFFTFGSVVSLFTLLALSAFPLSADASSKGNWKDYDTSVYHLGEEAVKQVAGAYGYLLAQDMTVETASSQFPEFSRSLLALSESFSFRFGDPAGRAESTLRAALGEHFDEFHAEYIEPNVRQIAATTFRRSDIEAFLAEMMKQVDGEMDEEVLSAILWLRYAGRPAEELIDGWIQTYSSAGNPKALGLDLRLELPMSWGSKPGVRPHILSQWTDQNGSGVRSINLTARDATELGDFTDEELYAALEQEAPAMVPAGARDVAVHMVRIEGLPFARIDFIGRYSRGGVEGKMLSRSYLSVFERRFLGLQCLTLITPLDGLDAETLKQDNSDLCALVANSLVIIDRW